MATSWLLCPYETYELDGRVRRRVALDARTPDIEAASGYWSEAEIDGDQALVLVRAPAKLLASLARDFPKVDDPEHAWTPTRSSPLTGRERAARQLTDVIEDVWDSRAHDDARRLVDALIARADVEGYVRLDGLPWPQAARILTMCARRGYGLDRISTGTFPTTSVLDSFTGSDEGPITTNWTTPLWASDNTLRRVSNQLARTASGAAWGDAYVDLGSYGADTEIYCEVPTKSSIELYLRVSSEGTDLIDGYEFNATSAGTAHNLNYVVDGAFTQMGATFSQAWANSDSWGYEGIGTALVAYFKSGVGAWSAAASRTDSTHAGSGRIALGINGSTGRVDNVGGGTVIPAAGGQPAGSLTLLGTGA